MLPLRDDVPATSRPWVMYLLIAANLLVFLYERALPPSGLHAIVAQYAATPAAFAEAHGAGASAVYLTLFTSMFLHGSWLHVIGNMWYLWIFGDNTEDRMGHGRFLLFYLLGGIVAGIGHVMLNWGSPVPSLGASGAIAAVLGAYLVMFPRARVLTLVPLFLLFFVQLPAALVLGLWFVLQLFSGAGSLGVHAAGAGVAYWAHIFGFVFGLATVHLFARRIRAYPTFRPMPGREGGSWWPNAG